jgi:hypothetical protein
MRPLSHRVRFIRQAVQAAELRARRHGEIVPHCASDVGYALMCAKVRDLQYGLIADGRNYVIEVCAPGRNPAPVSAGPFDVHIMADVPASLIDSDVEPEKVVRHVIDYVTPLVPASVTPNQWGKFSDVVLAWVCAHRAATA